MEAGSDGYGFDRWCGSTRDKIASSPNATGAASRNQSKWQSSTQSVNALPLSSSWLFL